MKPSKKEFKAIAMKCDQDQFDRIKPKLEKAGVKVAEPKGHRVYLYLTNNHLSVDGLVGMTNDTKNRTVHETWNEEIFLNACCIETELEFETFTVNRTGKGDLYVDGIKYVPENKESYTITKEQILKYDMREEFPEVFEVKLEIKKWYKKEDCIAFVEYLDNEDFIGYGIDYMGEWVEPKTGDWTNSHVGWIEMTHEEVFEALKSEAVRRGYKEGVYIEVINTSNEIPLSKNDYSYYKEDNRLSLGGWNVFINGIWAEIIKPKQMTQSDIEKELGYLIEIV